ncbi:hypothetical protein [Actibacterium lipolyticum]|uniref:hypothetical protein n=1 Tax=Actibacterium lipolyticum TaxID=1524263 RepID=UPI0011305B17|nr:hypothetical protein [Actibacterium lipolyticum]
MSDNSRASDEHYLRLGRGQSDDPSLGTIVQLQTPISGFTPNFREVEVVGKKGFKALCAEGGANQLGVFVYLVQTVDAGGGKSETYVNSRYMPYAMLTDLITATSATGLLQIRIPDTDVVKLNVTLRASPTGEPEFRTHKTEVKFENLPVATQQQIEAQLNFQSASISAFTAYQVLSTLGLWSANVADLGADVPDWAPTAKKVVVATLVTIGSVVLVFGEASEDHATIVVGGGLVAAGLVTNYWVNVWVPDFQPDPADNV